MNYVFKALNDETRRAILDLLRKEDLTAGAIAEHFNITKPSISHHLDLLKKADLITQVKKGQFIHYSINTSVLEDVFSWLINFQPLKTQKKHVASIKK